MKILISADMEGTCGVVNWVQVIPPEIGGGGRPTSTVEYERARLRMTREVNAAVEGAIAAGATEVVVNDSHDGMRNIIVDELHEQARYISGFDKELLMVHGVDEDGVDALLYTGYHARAGTPDGPLAHSFTGWVHDIRVDGTSMGEYGINALIAGHFGVPVAMVAGDNRAVEQTRELLGDQVVGVPIKRGYSVTAALNQHPERSRTMIREGAEEAVRNLSRMKPYKLPDGATVEMDLDHQSRVSQVEKLPGVERTGWRSFSFTPADGLELAHYMRALVTAASNPPG
ncbi:MAG: M55 family metallopeptidase [Thermomicrobiales bacterium]